MKFYIVDAFTQNIFGGNTAGVVLINQRDDFPKRDIMQKIAEELRYSETAFVKQIDKNEFCTKYFTPTEEVDLCGHATIAAFHVLKECNVINDNTIYYNKTLAGSIAIEINQGNIYMDMAEAKEGMVIERYEDIKDIYSSVGIKICEDYFVKNNECKSSKMLPQIISTGLYDIMLPIETKDNLDNLNPNFEKISEISKQYNVVGIHVFTRDLNKNICYCRNFAPLYGINEEAATGTSNGALTYYLYKHNLIKENEKNLFIQGESMGRCSKIISKLIIDDEIKIKIGGCAAIVACGELNI